VVTRLSRKYGSGNNLFHLGTRHSESVTFLGAKKVFTRLFSHLNRS
jgi:hypothetical protein